MFNEVGMNPLLNRFFSRFMDYGFFYLFGVFFSVVLPFDFSDLFYAFFAFVTPLFSAPLEALFLSKKGTTLGKAIFGITVKNERGSLLSFKEGLKYAFFVSRKGVKVAVRPIPRWRYLITLIVAILCGSSLFFGKELSEVAAQYEKKGMEKGWVQYIPSDGKFTVDFPKKPAVDSQVYVVPNAQPLNLSVHEAKAEAVFSVSYMELPRKWRIFSPSTLFKGAMNAVIEHTEGAVLIEKKQVRHKNYPALNFRLKQGEEEIQGRLILVGSTLYKLTITCSPEERVEQDSDRFLNSFDLNVVNP